MEQQTEHDMDHARCWDFMGMTGSQFPCWLLGVSTGPTPGATLGIPRVSKRLSSRVFVRFTPIEFL